MKHSKQMLTVGLLTATVVGGGLFAVSANAATNTGDDTLATKIATKFNLNKDEVQTVVTEFRTEKQAEHQAERKIRVEERLTQAVKDGKLTEAQKTKIIEYMASQESFFESLKDKTDEERKTAMETHKAEVQKWATDNGIDAQYLMPGGPGHRGGPGGGMMRGGHGEES